MKIKSSILKQVAFMATAVDKAPLCEANNNVHIILNNSILSFYVYGMAYTIRTDLTLDGDAVIDSLATFDVGVDAKKFFTFVKAVEDDYVELGITDNVLSLKTKRIKLALPKINIDEFMPALNISTTDYAGIPVSADFIKDLNSLIPFTAKNTNTVFNGITLTFANNMVLASVSDRIGVIVDRTMACHMDEVKSFTLPSETIVTLSKFASMDGRILVKSDDVSTTFITKAEDNMTIYLTTRLISGEPFVAHGLILNNTPVFNLVVNREELLNALTLYTSFNDTLVADLAISGMNMNIVNTMIDINVPLETNTNVESEPNGTTTISVSIKDLIGIVSVINSNKVIVYYDQQNRLIKIDGIYDEASMHTTALLSKIRRF